MERETNARASDESADAIRLALDAIHDLKEAGVSAAVARKLDAATLALTEGDPAEEDPAEPSPAPRPFGAFAGAFAIGPEFFEPMSEAERQEWATD